MARPLTSARAPPKRPASRIRSGNETGRDVDGVGIVGKADERSVEIEKERVPRRVGKRG